MSEMAIYEKVENLRLELGPLTPDFKLCLQIHTSTRFRVVA